MRQDSEFELSFRFRADEWREFGLEQAFGRPGVFGKPGDENRFHDRRDASDEKQSPIDTELLLD